MDNIDIGADLVEGREEKLTFGSILESSNTNMLSKGRAKP